MSLKKQVIVDRAELEGIVIDAMDYYRIRHAYAFLPLRTIMDVVPVLLAIALVCLIALLLILTVQSLTFPVTM